MALYRAGEPLVLSAEAEGMAKLSQESHRESSYNEGLIEEFLAKKVPKDWYRRTLAERRTWLDNTFEQGREPEENLMFRDRICAIEIWNECYRQAGFNRMKKSDAREINAILGRMPGWRRMEKMARFGGEYGPQRGYERA